MQVVLKKEWDKSAEVLVYGVTAEHHQPPAVARELDQAIKAKLFDPEKFGQQYSTTVDGKRILVIGLGKKAELTGNHLRRALGKAVRFSKSLRKASFSSNLLTFFSLPAEEAGRCSAEGCLLANYRFIKYFSKEKQEEHKPVERVMLQYGGDLKLAEQGLRQGKVIAECTNYAKDLINEPAAVVSPEYLEKEARRLAAGHLKVTVLNKADMEKLGMGALLGVAAGSDRPPKLILLDYKNGGNAKYAAIVGKGITFDSGGYNLKPTKYIEDMKSDMSGAAAVLCTIKALAALGVKKNIIGVMACTDNLVSGSAQKPGDIVRAYNGKTIEIGNTDAEGRLVLADALAYAEDRYKPEVMVDLATLTGACVVALGYECSGIMGKDDILLAQLEDAGKKSYDLVWKLPFFEEYQSMMDGSISDLNNCSTKGKGYEAGAISGGVFLSKFVDKAKWAHIDIAGPAYVLEDSDYSQKYATGAGVRLLCYWLMGL